MSSTITKDDEREARVALANYAGMWEGKTGPLFTTRHARTILALLDAPRMPRPEDVPDSLLESMGEAFWKTPSDSAGSACAAYRALFDHYTAQPKPRDAYGVEGGGTDWTVFASKRAALAYANDFPGSRIVKLVEAADE